MVWRRGRLAWHTALAVPLLAVYRQRNPPDLFDDEPLGFYDVGVPDPVVGNVSKATRAELLEHFRGASVLAVGATRGIGRGVAVVLARSGASVSVVGRSRAGGGAVVEAMRVVAPFPTEQQFQAYSADLFTVSGVLELTSVLIKKEVRFTHLVLSCGVWPNWLDPFTVDGLDKVFALDLLARYLLFRELVPTLHSGAKVLSILSSGSGGRQFSIPKIKAVLNRTRRHSGWDNLFTVPQAHDAFLRGAAARYPEFALAGTYPGSVATEIFTAERTFPSFLSDIIFGKLVPKEDLLSEEDCGENHAAILASPQMIRRPVTFFWYLSGRFTFPPAYDDDFVDWLWKFLGATVARLSPSTALADS